MTEMAAQWEALGRASLKVREAAGRLHAERMAIEAEFHRLVGVDWTGDPATAYDDYFRGWFTGLGDVEEGLAAMGDLIEATLHDLRTTEDGVTDALDTVAARIVERLG